jgi:hypothetical protein
MHAQGDDAHSIVHMNSFSTATHSCNKIEHHSDSYHDLRLDYHRKKGKKWGHERHVITTMIQFYHSPAGKTSLPSIIPRCF